MTTAEPTQGRHWDALPLTASDRPATVRQAAPPSAYRRSTYAPPAQGYASPLRALCACVSYALDDTAGAGARPVCFRFGRPHPACSRAPSEGRELFARLVGGLILRVYAPSPALSIVPHREDDARGKPAGRRLRRPCIILSMQCVSHSGGASRRLHQRGYTYERDTLDTGGAGESRAGDFG